MWIRKNINNEDKRREIIIKHTNKRIGKKQWYSRLIIRRTQASKAKVERETHKVKKKKGRHVNKKETDEII